MKKLVVLAPFSEEKRNQIKEATPDFDMYYAPETSVDEQITLLKDCEICIGEPDWAAVLNSESLRLIQMTWAGADRYTRSTHQMPEQIQLCTASGAFGHTMSHYALAGVLSLYHHLPFYHRQQQIRSWKQTEAERTMIGATVLIFGAGNIGSCTAKLFRASGASRIIGVRRKPEIPDEFDEVCTLQEAERWLPYADIVIGCMPAAEENLNYLNEQRLRMMKPDAVLLNMGRGTLVDTDALVKVLKEGILYGTVLDVTNPEPLPESHPLWDMPNVIITPHIAGPSIGNPVTEQLITEICCENLKRFREGLELKNQMCMEKKQ